MRKIQSMNKGFPTNYILLGDADYHSSCVEKIIADEKASFPEVFEGNRDSFPFELRYVPPFDKNFDELKRLQGTAAAAAGRRDQFRGYVIVDLSNYLTHANEHYLEVALRFFIDMSDYWRYIFLVDNADVKAAKELVGKVLTIIMHDLPFKVCEAENDNSVIKVIDQICQKNHLVCTPMAKGMLQELVEKDRFDLNIVSALLEELPRQCGTRITVSSIVGHLIDGDSVVKYLLSAKELNRLVEVVVQKKENKYGEKEAV